MMAGRISKSSNGWQLFVIADGSLSCENFNLGCDDIDTVDSMLKKQYEKRMREAHVIVSYDNWSGVYIMHDVGYKSQKSDELIREIFTFLSNINK